MFRVSLPHIRASLRGTVYPWTVSIRGRLLNLAACLLLIASASAFAGGESRKDLIKVAVFYKLSKFVEWPAERFASEGSEFLVGVVGEETLFKLTQYTLREKLIKNRKIVVKHFSAPIKAEGLKECHALLVGSSEEAQLAEVIREVREASVLTVGDVKDFARRGGIIGLVERNNRLRFEINVSAASRGKLRIQAKLLKLATVIEDENGQEGD